MVKRIKKPSVPPAKRLDWLRRNEEFGEIPTQIAEADGYDVRTVRTHIERAVRERDQKQARISFVKENLEKHHQDMCNRANGLLSVVTAEREIDLNFAEDLYLNAMQRHLPRAPLWNRIRRWNDTLDVLENLKVEAENKLDKSLKRTSLTDIKSDGAEGVVTATVAALVHQFEQWARGDKRLDFGQDWVIEGREDGKINIRYGFSHFGWIVESDLDTIKKVIGRYEIQIKKWPEYRKMEEQTQNMRELRNDIITDLKGIIIRRVLPGNCPYCPI